MEDNTLLLVLCGILTVIILYYIFKSCSSSSGYSNKLNTYNNDNRIVKLNKKNERMARDLFQSTNEVFNMNDFFSQNEIKIYINKKESSSDEPYVINYNQNLKLEIKKEKKLQKLFIKKMN